MTTTTAGRAPNIVASGLIALIGVSVAYISYTQQPSEAFFFPRIISTIFSLLALWDLGKTLLEKSANTHGLDKQTILRIAPGLGVAIVFVFWAVQALGFYTASTLSFFILITLYDPAPYNKAKPWVKRLIITAGFLAIIYSLFALLLNVYTPPETLFQS